MNQQTSIWMKMRLSQINHKINIKSQTMLESKVSHYYHNKFIMKGGISAKNPTSPMIQTVFKKQWISKKIHPKRHRSNHQCAVIRTTRPEAVSIKTASKNTKDWTSNLLGQQFRLITLSKVRVIWRSTEIGTISSKRVTMPMKTSVQRTCTWFEPWWRTRVSNARNTTTAWTSRCKSYVSSSRRSFYPRMSRGWS